jgi:glutamyl-tRNA synthetase
MEDNILIKSDGMPTYNFAHVVDDHLMHVTYVIRGNEYLSSTPKYNLLYDAFGWEKPQYIHLTQIMKDETRKLSKRHGDANFDDFIRKGYLPHAIVNYIALLGWSPKGTQEKFTMQELIENFSVEGLSKSNSIFDEKKMAWLNGEYIKELSFEEFYKYALPYFEKSSIKGRYDYEPFARLLQSRIEIFSEIPEKVKFIDEYQRFPSEKYENQRFKIDQELAYNILKSYLEKAEKIDFSEDAWKELVKEVADLYQIKQGAVYSTMRWAISGVDVTPGGFVEIAVILGKEKSIERLKQSLAWLKEDLGK